MDERDIPYAPVAVPAEIATAVAGYHWARDRIGEAGAAVYRLHGKADAPDLYLKHGSGSVADDVTDEMCRLRWLRRYLPVPTLVRFVASDDAAWLLTTAMAGETAYQAVTRGEGLALVDTLVAFLQRLHAIPAEQCPFASDLARRMVAARERIDGGLVDLADFDKERSGWSAERVWDEMQALLPLSPDPVVTHGDFSLDNVLVRNGEIVGCIDVGRVGLADRYQDLAILFNCLGEFGPALQARMFAAYGIDTPDRRKLEFHLLLDELF